MRHNTSKMGMGSYEAAAGAAFWETVREQFADGFNLGAVESEPEPTAPTAEDIAALSADDYSAQREALGIRQASTDILGLSTNDDSGSGFPSWTQPPPAMVPEASELEAYASQRKELGVRDASSVFGASPAQPRVNASPWRAV